MFQLQDRDPARSLETYLCGVWADPHRREAWRSGFQAIGKEALVREKFDDFYKSVSLDGGKIETFLRAYKANGLKPTEVDYGFFKDRSAQTSPGFEPIKRAIADFVRDHQNGDHWQVRRAIALGVRPGNLPEDRLGRDVAFFADGAGTQLSAEERSAWQARGPIKAADAGLSDAREYVTFVPGPAINTHIAHPSTLTDAERKSCPAVVLNTQHPPPHR